MQHMILTLVCPELVDKSSLKLKEGELKKCVFLEWDALISLGKCYFLSN